MRAGFAHTFVSLTFIVALLPPLDATAQALEPIEDPDAYAIYALLVPPMWPTVSKETLLLQQETDITPRCRSSVAGRDPDWEAVENAFKEANARVRLLRPMLPVKIPYRLIPRAEIEADDARLALKYPGIWMRRPESIEYAAVSSVGFNPAKTRAMVYVRLRSSGRVTTLELEAGEWKVARGSGCFGIAEARPLGREVARLAPRRLTVYRQR